MQPVPTTSLPMPAARPSQAGGSASVGPVARGQTSESNKFDALVAGALAGAATVPLPGGPAPGGLTPGVNAAGGSLPPDGHLLAALARNPVAHPVSAGLPVHAFAATAGPAGRSAGTAGLLRAPVVTGALAMPATPGGDGAGLPRSLTLADLPPGTGVTPGAGLLLRVSEDGAGERRGGTEGLAPVSEHHAPAAPRNSGLEPAASSGAARAQPLPVDQPAVFGERLSHHVSVMLTQHAQSARIAVTPPELGPVDVRVVVVGDEASVQLISPHAATRDALEEALPRLRAMFADSGLVLDQAGVFSETPKQHHHAYAEHDRDGVQVGPDPSATVAEGRVRVSVGLIDAFV